MLELFPEGIEELLLGSEIELAAYTSAGGEERVWQVFGSGRVEDVDSGWEERWKQFHRPISIGPLWVGPPWEARPDTGIPVVIDPGRAFGTGAHPTTRLCLEHLISLDRTSLADLGCGSGVIAIAAVRLGFEPVLALDHDEAAVSAAAANVRANGVEVTVERLDVQADALPDVDTVVANIALEPVERLLERLEARRAVVSGYLPSERPRADAWRHVRRLESTGWAADLFERD